MSDPTLARLTVPARLALITPARDFIGAVAQLEGFAAKALGRLELLVEEASLFVVEQAFEPGEAGDYTLILLRRPGRLVVALEYKGLPIDFSRLPGEGELGLTLMRGLAEEIQFLNLGKAGRRIEFSASLPVAPITDYLSESERNREAPPADAGMMPAPRLRMMGGEDAVALSRCIYRSYGYTYVEFIYFPDRVKEMLDAGLMISCVAEGEDQEIVGHIALLLASPEAKVAESGIAVVDPRYRGHNLFKAMKQQLIGEGQRRGLYGIFSEAMTLHPFTQKGNHSLGAHETGFQLAFLPRDVDTRKIEASPQGDRAAIALFYLRTNPEPPRRLYPPARHRPLIEDICQRIGLDRQIADSVGTEGDGGETRLTVRVRPDLGQAFLQIESFGADLVAQVRHHLIDLCCKKIDVIYLDLPLSDPATACCCDGLEGLGLFFAGMIPELDEQRGDVLRLQYLNNLSLNLEAIVVVSPAGRALLDHIAAERLRVGQSVAL